MDTSTDTRLYNMESRPQFNNRPITLQHDLRPEANMVTASQIVGVTPAGDYTWRPPSPPHIHVPQAPEDQEYFLPEPIGNRYGYAEEEWQTLQQLTKIDRPITAVRDWKYEQRRSAQSILPFLYLGPSAATRDNQFLVREGITMLLVIRNTMSAHARLLSGDRVAATLGIESGAVDVAGSPELIAAFPRATKTINEHLLKIHNQRASEGNPNSHGKVLVFCESGNERSAAVVAAYLMATFSIDLVSAIQFVQSQRFCVAFDDGLKTLLHSYQDLLSAQVSVMESPPAPALNINVGAKRRREETQDEDMDLDTDRADDEERFGGRSHFIPFHDGASGHIASQRN